MKYKQYKKLSKEINLNGIIDTVLNGLDIVIKFNASGSWIDTKNTHLDLWNEYFLINDSTIKIISVFVDGEELSDKERKEDFYNQFSNKNIIDTFVASGCFNDAAYDVLKNKYKIGQLVWSEINENGPQFINGKIIKIEGQNDNDVVRLETSEGIITTLVGQIWE